MNPSTQHLVRPSFNIPNQACNSCAHPSRHIKPNSRLVPYSFLSLSGASLLDLKKISGLLFFIVVVLLVCGGVGVLEAAHAMEMSEVYGKWWRGIPRGSGPTQFVAFRASDTVLEIVVHVSSNNNEMQQEKPIVYAYQGLVDTLVEHDMNVTFNLGLFSCVYNAPSWLFTKCSMSVFSDESIIQSIVFSKTVTENDFNVFTFTIGKLTFLMQPALSSSEAMEFFESKTLKADSFLPKTDLFLRYTKETEKQLKTTLGSISVITGKYDVMLKGPDSETCISDQYYTLSHSIGTFYYIPELNLMIANKPQCNPKCKAVEDLCQLQPSTFDPSFIFSISVISFTWTGIMGATSKKFHSLWAVSDVQDPIFNKKEMLALSISLPLVLGAITCMCIISMVSVEFIRRIRKMTREQDLQTL